MFCYSIYVDKIYSFMKVNRKYVQYKFSSLGFLFIVDNLDMDFIWILNLGYIFKCIVGFGGLCIF